MRSIDVDYPPRLWWTIGPDWLLDYWWIAALQPFVWIVYWFVVSMIAGFCFRGVLNVNVWLALWKAPLPLGEEGWGEG